MESQSIQSGFFFSSRRRHTRWTGDWSSDVCSSDLKYFSPRSFGHTGFTGTSIWVDPEKQLFVVLLTNRVYPTRENQKQIPLRKAVADAAQAAILDAPLINWEASR